MNLRNMVVDTNSEADFRVRLLNILASGAGLVHVRTSEVTRAIHAIRNTIIMEQHKYAEWDVNNGMREFTHDNIYSLDVEGDGAIAIDMPLTTIWEKYLWWRKTATDEDKSMDYVYALVNPQYQLGNAPTAFQHFLEMSHHLPQSTVRLIMVTSDISLPDVYSPYFISIDFDLPGHSELLDRLNMNLEDYCDEEALNLSDNDRDRITVAAAGMQFQDFDVAVSSTIVETTYNQISDEEELSVTVEDLVAGIHKAKTAAIKKSDILELLDGWVYTPSR